MYSSPLQKATNGSVLEVNPVTGGEDYFLLREHSTGSG